jgi:hypothetical protein
MDSELIRWRSRSRAEAVTLRIGLPGNVMLDRTVGEALSGDAEPGGVWQPDLRELVRGASIVTGAAASGLAAARRRRPRGS